MSFNIIYIVNKQLYIVCLVIWSWSNINLTAEIGVSLEFESRAKQWKYHWGFWTILMLVEYFEFVCNGFVLTDNFTDYYDITRKSGCYIKPSTLLSTPSRIKRRVEYVNKQWPVYLNSSSLLGVVTIRAQEHAVTYVDRNNLTFDTHSRKPFRFLHYGCCSFFKLIGKAPCLFYGSY